MVQDTRKDQRAKVLTMTVRYKSATIDEFIEHHSHDVSRGGLFIKTPSPFPPGTLLKFEIRIAEDQTIITGVGRVVWKRDAAQVTEDRPVGMGVKFLKIDETSRQTIDLIVATQGDAPSAFDASAAGGAAVAVPVPNEPEQVAAATGSSPPRVSSRKATMLGLGTISLADVEAAAAKKVEQAAAKKAEEAAAKAPEESSFFPKTDGEADMPPPEERTVMKQAAELLAEALKGAGGSLDEIGSGFAQMKPAEAKPEEPKLPESFEAPKPVEALPPKEPVAPVEESKPIEAQPAPAATVEEAPSKHEEVSLPPPVKKAEPAPKKEPDRAVEAKVAGVAPKVQEEPESSNAMRILLLVAALAIVIGAIWYLAKPSAPETSDKPVATTPPAQVSVAPKATVTAPPATATTTAPPAATPSATVAAPSATAPATTAAPASTPKPPPTTAPPATTAAKPPPPANTQPKPPKTKPKSDDPYD